VTPFIAIAS